MPVSASGKACALVIAGACLTGACTAVQAETAGAVRPSASAPAAQKQEKFKRDRAAILAMAGNYDVTFDFTETVPFMQGYELKERKVSGGHEVVRVIEDRGDFISLQHILVAGKEEKFAIKHWRQDWSYEPESVLVFVGGNAWKKREVSRARARGKWAQIVYQVDDSPRYGALAAWSHEEGVSEWQPPAEWRPLPRRDATTRDDYHAIDAVNRHAITPAGWVHEQDNSKLVLAGTPHVLVREVGVNTYVRSDEFDVPVAENYWAATNDYWAAVRAEWARLEAQNTAFGLTIQGEAEDLYTKLLELADEVKDGKRAAPAAAVEARRIIATYTTTEIGTLQERLKGNVRNAEH